MPISVRRALYGLLTVLGFVMTVPLTVNATSVQAALNELDPLAIDPDVSAWLSGLGLLFFGGVCIAAGFLYLALSTGHPRAWRPVGADRPSCARCGAEVSHGLRHCPGCDQQLTW